MVQLASAWSNFTTFSSVAKARAERRLYFRRHKEAPLDRKIESDSAHGVMIACTGMKTERNRAAAFAAGSEDSGQTSVFS